ncbi:MAG: hypothetical protein WC732_00375 [Candidatus Omnitrophota bacterium]
MSRQNNVFFGFFLGAAAVVVFLGLTFFSYKVTWRLLDYLDIEHKRPQADYSFLKEDFRLNFENERDLKVLDAAQAAFSRSVDFPSEGKYSLKVEFPSGREFPGVGLEVYGRDCFDWTQMEDFSFTVFNAIDAPARLTVHIKSGAAYPKKDYETTQEIPALSMARFRITRQELANMLDLNQISAVRLFMQDPRTTFFLFFDDMKVTRRDS